jgi:hypothetical protein
MPRGLLAHSDGQEIEAKEPDEEIKYVPEKIRHLYEEDEQQDIEETLPYSVFTQFSYNRFLLFNTKI